VATSAGLTTIPPALSSCTAPNRGHSELIKASADVRSSREKSIWRCVG